MIEIITIGDELIEGRLVDTNAGRMSERLTDEGFHVTRHTSVGDDVEVIAEVLRAAAARSDAVLASGGLGPTSDDLTAEAAATAFGLPIERNDAALEHVRRFFADRGRRMSPTNEKQADLPRGCFLLPNPGGTATGFGLEIGTCRLYFMPGVPRELDRMFEDTVLADLRGFLSATPPSIATVKVFGKGESEVAEMLAGLDGSVSDGCSLTVQYRATFPEIHVRLVVRADDRGAADEAAQRLATEARQRLGRYVFAFGGERLATSFPAHVIERLLGSGRTLAAAEACSGGELAALLSSVTDSATVFRGGVVMPSLTVRGALIEGDAESLESDESVTISAAEDLARAIRVRFGADLGVSTLGSPSAVAGQPPGMLIVSVATESETTSRELVFPVEPDRYRRLAAYVALAMVVRSLESTRS